MACAALLTVALAQWVGRRRLFWVEVLIALAAGVAVGILLAGWLAWRRRAGDGGLLAELRPKLGQPELMPRPTGGDGGGRDG